MPFTTIVRTPRGCCASTEPIRAPAGRSVTSINISRQPLQSASLGDRDWVNMDDVVHESTEVKDLSGMHEFVEVRCSTKDE